MKGLAKQQHLCGNTKGDWKLGIDEGGLKRNHVCLSCKIPSPLIMSSPDRFRQINLVPPSLQGQGGTILAANNWWGGCFWMGTRFFRDMPIAAIYLGLVKI